MSLNDKTETYEQIEAREAMEKSVSRLNLPPRFNKADLDTFDQSYQPRAFAMAQEFSKGFTKATARGIYLFGLPGSGKTHLVSAIARTLIPQNVVRFVTVPELLLDIKKSFNNSHINDEYLDILGKTQVLILDDLGSEKPTEWVQETLFVLLNRRYTHYLPTIITSNCSLDQLAERLGYRIASRIAEMCDVVELKAVDYRIRKNK